MNTLPNTQKDDFFERLDFGIRRGVARALAKHKQAGESIVISRNGKIIEVPPEEIKIPEEFKDILEKQYPFEETDIQSSQT